MSLSSGCTAGDGGVNEFLRGQGIVCLVCARAPASRLIWKAPWQTPLADCCSSCGLGLEVKGQGPRNKQVHCESPRAGSEQLAVARGRRAPGVGRAAQVAEPRVLDGW